MQFIGFPKGEGEREEERMRPKIENCMNQCSGSWMIYSGPGSSSEFSEFRIQAKVSDPCGSNPCYLIIFGNCKQNHLKFNHKEESINYLPFSISYYSSTVHKVQNSKRNNIFIYLLFHVLLDPQHCIKVIFTEYRYPAMLFTSNKMFVVKNASLSYLRTHHIFAFWPPDLLVLPCPVLWFSSPSGYF